jgi:putative ABC transport system permease protein
VGCGAGTYPALVLSTQGVSAGLKDSQDATFRANTLRKFLVVAQFTLSVVLVFCTLAVLQQMAYIQNKPLGFDRQNVIAVDINSPAVRGGAQAIRDGFLAHPQVLSVSNSSRIPGDWKPSAPTVQASLPGRNADEARTLDLFVADERFLDTFGISLSSGRNFTATDNNASVIVNRTLVELMGWDQPLGQRLHLTSRANPTAPETTLEANVVGVVDDFHYQSLHRVIGPVVIQNGQAGNPTLLPHDYISVRIAENDIPGTLEHLRSVMRTHDAVTPFEYNFVEAQMDDNFYSSDRMTATLFFVAAGIAIFIACMGLFGLTSFTTEQRGKEIGIRKVLGATIANIVELLSADFMKLVVVAILLALPAGWYLMNLWLQSFAYTQGIGAGTFLVSALLAVVVSLGTVSFQSVKVAMRNPIESISYE